MNTHTDLRADIRKFIDDNFLMGGGSAALADGDSFLDHHVMDSTGFLELIEFLEATYAIAVDDADMVPENLDSIDNVAEFIRRKRGS